MRASDLVRGKISTPVSIIDGREDKTLPGNIPGQSNFNTKTPPPDISPEQPPEQRIPLDDTPFATTTPPPVISPEQPPERRIPLDETPFATKTPPLATRGKNIYTDAMNYLQEVRERLPLSGEPLNLEVPLRIIEQMIAEPSLVDEMYQFTLAFGYRADFEISSSVNNMIYCFKIGVRMGYAPFNLTEICLAALHHDIGMLLIPDAIIGKAGELNASELTEIRKHTKTGRDLLRSYDLAYPNFSRAVYEHHERENGQGYPLGIKGEKICEYAKIIGICDSYEAMTHNRPHRKAAAQYISVLELAETKNMFFAPYIVKVFLDEFTLYPVGSYVRLNNKAVGVVVGTNRSNPFKPTVRIISDGQGNRILDERLIDLADTAILNIVAGISAEEVPT
jgi:HD-GYP domain-containing protein (c-di-GMP phosphodiesterase class II)